MTYRIPTKVVKIEEKKKHLATNVEKTTGENQIVMVTTVDIGWFVLFEGSQESLFVGMEKPADLEPGTEVEIIIAPKIKDKKLVLLYRNID